MAHHERIAGRGTPHGWSAKYSLPTPHGLSSVRDAAGNLFVGGTAQVHGIDTASGVIEKHPNAGGPT